ncbi:hypothetical protein [Chitinophaga arvensicola]|uniref:Uncharacterized protein n=1 Tax=Chitinophaga arvensicola TaxID=29529 RepID=A0A1I0RHU6_9BACT|nr:hypothetical protein [Chitinophaga arvensicola]SEW40491.1 hypothetical protein SAMN04488122_2861 [Chitinophaga arvensicola]
MNHSYFKDLVIYIIPGILLNVIVLAILFDKNAIQVITNIELIKSNAFIFSFLIFSALSGFIQSQFQITIINKLIYKKQDMRLIVNLQFPTVIKENLARRIKEEFKLEGVAEDIIMKDKEYFYQCLTIVLMTEYKRMGQIIDRAISVSQFGSAIIFPTILCVYYIFSKIEMNVYIKWCIFLVIAVLIVRICYFTVRRFRETWIEEVYKVFLFRPIPPSAALFPAPGQSTSETEDAGPDSDML